MIVRWRGEEGSTSLTLTWFMLVALLMAIGLDSFLGIYIARQQGQSAADAAALAVVREIAFKLLDDVPEEADRRVHLILTDPVVDQRVGDYEDEFRSSQEECSKNPSCKPLTGAEIDKRVRNRRISEYQASFARQFRGSLDQPMAARIAAGTWASADQATLRDELIPDDDDLGCLIMAAGTKHRGDILTEAAAFTEANQARLDWSKSELSRPEGKHLVAVLRMVHPFGAEWISKDGTLPSVQVNVLAVVATVGDRTPHYPTHC